MEPRDYARALLGRWKIVAVAGLIGLAAGLLTAPPGRATTASAPRNFSAAHILIADSSQTPVGKQATSSALEFAILLASVGEVPARAAQALGMSGPEALAPSVSVSGDPAVGTLRIVGRDPDPARAESIANTVAAELRKFMQEQKAAAKAATVAEARAVVDDTQRRLNEVLASLSQSPLDSRGQPTDLSLVAQRDGLLARLRDAQASLSAAQAGGEPRSGFETLQSARAVPGGGAASTPSAAAGSAAARGGATGTTVAPAVRAARDRTSTARRMVRTFRTPIAAGMGLFLGAGLALVRERFDTRVRSRRLAERAFGLPVIAEIPSRPRRTRKSHQLVVHSDPSGLEAESYRLLRSYVLQSGPGAVWIPAAEVGPAEGASDGQLAAAVGQPARASSMIGPETALWVRANQRETPSPSGPEELRSLLVTSPSTGDGKTAVAVNVAAAISETGTRTLVLDLDFRRSRMESYFDGPPAHGLGDILEGVEGAHLEGVIASTLNAHLHVALSGRPLGHPSQALAAERQIVETARRHFERVLIDAPPLLAFSDARELIPASDAVVLVFRLNRTTVTNACDASEALARLGARVLGVVAVGTTTGRRAHSARRRGRGAAPHKPPLMAYSGAPLVDEPPQTNGAADTKVAQTAARAPVRRRSRTLKTEPAVDGDGLAETAARADEPSEPAGVDEGAAAEAMPVAEPSQPHAITATLALEGPINGAPTAPISDRAADASAAAADADPDVAPATEPPRRRPRAPRAAPSRANGSATTSRSRVAARDAPASPAEADGEGALAGPPRRRRVRRQENGEAATAVPGAGEATDGTSASSSDS